MKHPLWFLLGSLLATGACARAPDADANAPAATDAMAVASATSARPATAVTAAPASAAMPTTTASAATALPSETVAETPTPAAGATPQLVVVHKNPTCGCCEMWVEHLRDAGFRVEVRNEDNLDPIKQRLGVPYGKGSCHTAEVAGYVVEGHVPAADIRRLLAEKPKARGLVLPGMPLGSPGMEVEGATPQPYTVELVQADGSTVAYARHAP